jgi:cell division protein FtsI/penicillin-binding protein 2
VCPVSPAAARPRPRFRPLAILASIFVLLASAAACAQSEKESEALAALTDFTEALSRQDANAAAQFTDAPAEAAPMLEEMFAGLGSEHVEVVVQAMTPRNDEVDFTLGSVWHFGEGAYGERLWSNTTKGVATRDESGWRIHWQPDLVVPELTANSSVRFRTTYPDPPGVYGSDGSVLMEQQTVNVVNFDPAGGDPAAAADALAAALGPVVPSLTRQSILEMTASGKGQPVTVVTLRDSDYEPVAAQLAAIPGVAVAQQARLLTADQQLSSPVLDELRATWEEEQQEAAGWAVELVSASGQVERLAGEAAERTSAIRTSLDPGAQLAAQEALSSIPQAAAIVALRPSTGGVLAVAQNDAASSQGPIALTGLYPPGSTFKTITAAAALDAGIVGADETVACPGVAMFEDREIPNDDRFDLGSVPFRTAFARSCNTTMAQLALELPETALHDTAQRFGLGVDYTIPGLTTVTGDVPDTASAAEKVESAIGQGSVTASPFGMAMVAATVANGGAPTPELIESEPATADAQPGPLSEAVLGDLRGMMREVVASGTASQLSDISGLIGKTGTAEFGSGASVGSGSGGAHGWFIGARGDVAFAVFVDDAGSSGPAVEAAGRFIRAIG